jgi:proteasome lid subunit RPN8/RPN11
MTRQVELHPLLAESILVAARLDHSRECCGLLEGERKADGYCVTVLHPARNLSGDPQRFEIDPLMHIKAQKLARLRGREIVGCYHSHPGGRAEPSAADLSGASEDDFLWLIAGSEGLRAFVYLRGEFVGADWVTSSE